MKCAPGYHLTKDECAREATSLGGFVVNNKLAVGHWHNVAYGCSISARGGRVFYNVNFNAFNDGTYTPVCKALTNEVTLLPSGQGIKCRTYYDFSEAECVAAASLVGGNLRGGILLVGNWPTAPSGCFVEASDKAIHYSTNTNGINDGYFQPVCKKPKEQINLLPAGIGIKCIPGYNFSEEKCISVAASVGGNLRDGKFLVGDWPDKPYGCFIAQSDKAIHFGTNATGYNDGFSQPICMSLTGHITSESYYEEAIVYPPKS
mmetsp:Transcript_42656/g.43212  ORF Transcript_42656/g.43212 Transcript_42656/m.43212 type:complete len:261 (-) Transcript_42656:65-847(-)|eukprot:CAMPEP_0171294344 /NCGR_PEP_ID=MMETSP0816-20121228/2820_1 /TAXON_ID=420281 /ORGANISM="Proboscia inermis, Strain CCAP1064/1" /LENGTH=260 /DNA_ID=CAMNT_0011766093 /DNA_START=180 /DNA_END=962 /DNA_ORIENTATION=-